MRYFIKFNLTREFVQKLYRLTDKGNLQYHGEQGGWHYSDSYGHNSEAFISSEFTEEITEQEMLVYLNKENARGHD